MPVAALPWILSAQLIGASGTTPVPLEGWTEARSPHFTVVTDAGEPEAARLVLRFERLRAVFGRLWPTARMTGRAMVIVAPRRSGRMAALLPAEWTRSDSSHPAGVMVAGPDRIYLAVGDDERAIFPGSVATHEFVHALVESNLPWAPIWLNEGLAEFFAAGRATGEPATFGLPHPAHLSVLRQARWLPLEAVLTASRGAPMVTARETSTIFYAEAWALTHYLKLGEGGRHAASLTTFTALVARGSPLLEASQEAFGNLDVLERRLRAYVRGETFFDARLPPAAPGPDPAVATAALQEWQAALVLGDLLAHVDRLDDAERLIGIAIDLREASSECWERRALVAMLRQQLAEARAAAEKALALDPSRPLAHYLRGVALLASADGLTRQSTSEAEFELRRAIAGAPWLAPAYTTLGGLLAARDGATIEALALIERAIALDPSTIGHHVTLGQVLLMSGDAVEAQRVGERARNAARTATERDSVERLLAAALGVPRR
jgi:tetratricopeptide (TPR) repeat protein